MNPKPKLSNKAVTVRMYYVGFGDSFLLFFPASDGRHRKVLIDCGKHQQSVKSPNIADVAQQIIEDATDADGVPRIDLVIATHRHQDHVSGFEKPGWDKVEVKEVWMPWTEDPNDPVALEILKAQSTTAAAVHKAAKKKTKLTFGATQQAASAAAALAENALTNAKAMKTLHQGFAGGKKIPRSYLPYKKREANTFQVAALPDVTVHVMGPSRDPDVINDLENASQEYLLLAGSLPAYSNRFLSLFENLALSPKEFSRNYKNLALKAVDIHKLSNIGDDRELAAAISNESAVNGTSLMIMFETGKAHMLFPGDAQWGTWNAAMNDTEWHDLMKKSTFYKIGHHGSHNATPIDFVEKILRPNQFVAMACTGPTQKWTKTIPRPKLIKNLSERAKGKANGIIRSDKQNKPYVDLDVPI